MSEDGKKLKPLQRFPEFLQAGDWKVAPLGVLCDVLNNRRRPITGSDRERGEFPYYGASGIVDYVNGYIFDERLLLVGEDGAKWGAYEKTAFIVEGKYWVNNHAHVLKATAINDSFLENYLVKLDLSPFVTGAAPPKLTLGKLKGIPIPFPPTIQEQKKIADCLSSLDELITAEEMRLDTLKSNKKGLMQQLFPLKGKVIPSLRFPEFRDAGEWRMKSFDKLFTVGNGRDYKHLLTGEVPVYGSGGYMLSVNDFLYDGESVCIGRKGTINNPIFLTGKFWTVDTLFYTHSFKECLPKFIYLIFQNINWLDHNEAGGIPSLAKANILKIEVAVPGLGEQKKIVDCLSSIDFLISSQTEKVDLLKAHKRGLLQQLFPVHDEDAS
ncbi:restriction endonuclease subunit S [Polynucleobacter sp.]|uniref:restriction endonuclease subunit S n=1 Tax=Polynucleobacter sp. TaxID=2029855 RepID=UPI00258C9821|nr:restriction endonuclease subunit S [Polynucleobacter sp.]MCX7237126.1 restriction endonuclease subunit S [Polynucleobacter sp.]